MSNSVIGALRANLSLDSTRFERGARRAQGSANSLRRSIMTISAGITAMGTGMAAAIRGQLSAIDDLGKAADRIGIPVEDLSRLQHAADLSAVSMGNLEASLQRLAREMVENEDKFSAIGVAVRDAEGNMRPIRDVLADLADVMQAMPEGAERTALAYDLMGRQGAALIPMLEGGAEGLRTMTEEAERLGLTVESSTYDAVASFNDNLSRLTAAVRGFVREITERLAPVMAGISDAVVAAIGGFRSMPEWLQRASVAATGLTVALTPLAAGLALIVGGLGALAAPVLATVGIIAAAAGAWAAFRSQVDPTPETIDAVVDAQEKLNQVLGTFAETGAPQAGAEAQNYARQLEEQARAALAAAEAELAVQEARLASVSAFPDAARVNPAYGQIAGDVDTATARVAELRATLDGARRTLDALNRSALYAGASSGDFSEVVTTVNVNTGELADTPEDLNSGLGRMPANVESGATALDKMKEAARQTQSEVAGMAQGLGRFLTQVAKGADAARQAIANLLSRAAEILLNRGLMSLLGGMNLSGGLGSVLSGLFGNGLSLTGSTAALTTAAGAASASALMPATGGLGASAAGSSVNINVNVDGANGDQHVMDLVAQGVQTGLSRFDRALPGRVREIQSNPRRR